MNHVADALDDPGIELRSFSYRRALLGRWDVLHVHWPETLARHHEPVRRAARLLGMVMLIIRIIIGRKKVLRTVHNVSPHDPGSVLEARLIDALGYWTTASIHLNPFSTLNAKDTGNPSFLIPHGHYRDFLTPTEYSTATDEFRILYFGFIKPYKRVEDLLRAFAQLTVPSLRLRLVGRATPTLKATIGQALSADNRITAHLDFASDSMLSEELAKTNLVVLPYSATLNSGAVLHALSANRPVLVADSEISRWLAREVGDGWLYFFQPPLDAHKLEEIVRHVQLDDRPSTVHFEGRDWVDVAQQHANAYRALLAK